MQVLLSALLKYRPGFHRLVPFDANHDSITGLDLSADQMELATAGAASFDALDKYVSRHVQAAGFRYGIGGYDELRGLYGASALFDGDKPGAEPRRLHLGTDIWGLAGTVVYAPLGGMVHSTGFNNANGDYGATIILLHQLDGIPFYTLYGHLSLRDVQMLPAGKYVSHGQVIGHFGTPAENGNWPPHLHFQVILDMQLKQGDYPGVCKFSEREKYLANCPDPDLMINFNRYLKKSSTPDNAAA